LWEHVQREEPLLISPLTVAWLAPAGHEVGSDRLHRIWRLACHGALLDAGILAPCALLQGLLGTPAGSGERRPWPGAQGEAERPAAEARHEHEAPLAVLGDAHAEAGEGGIPDFAPSALGWPQASHGHLGQHSAPSQQRSVSALRGWRG